MEISELVILSLIIFASLLFIRLIRMRYFPSNINPPMPTKKLIGGCEGTRFGCCPDKQTSCIDEECSNCLLDPTPDLGTLENSSQKNEENKRDFRIKNENLRSIEDKIKNLKSDKTTLEDEIQDLENQLKDPLGVANEEWIKRELEIKREELSKYDKKIETLEKEEETEEAELSETAKELSLSEQFLKKMNEMLDKINFVKSSDPAEPAADEPAADEPADDEPDAGITNPGLREEINERASENNTGDSRNVTRYNIGSGSELEESRKCAVPIQNFGEDNAILPVGYILNTRSTSENDIPCAWLPENNKSDCQIWKCDTVNGYEGNAEQNQCALPEQSCLNEYSDPTSSLAIKNCAKEYTLSGCTKPNKCISPTDTTGYKNIVERELDKDNFDVTAECATGFEGTVEAKVCTKPGEPYTLSSCIAAAPFVPIKLPRGIFESQSFPFVTENVCTAPPCNEDGCSFSFWEMTNDGAKGRGFEWNDTNKKYEVKSWGGTGPKPYYQVSKTNQDYTYTWRDQDGIVGHFKSKMERPKLNDGLYEVEWDNADGGSHFYRAETDSDSGNPRLKIYTDKAETIPVAPGELNWSCQSTRYQIGVDVQDRGGSRITIETGKNDMTGADVQLGTYRVIADLDGWSKMEGTITPVPAAAQN